MTREPGARAEHEKTEREIPAPTRRAVLERDNYQCRACGTGGENRLQLHHWVYRSRGGTHDPSNLVTVCFRCHRKIHEAKLDIYLKEWRPGEWTAFCFRIELWGRERRRATHRAPRVPRVPRVPTASRPRTH